MDGVPTLPCCIALDAGDILNAIPDGLKGMPEMLVAVYLATRRPTCILHLVCNSLDYASRKDKKSQTATIRPIRMAINVEGAQAELDAFR